MATKVNLRVVLLEVFLEGEDVFASGVRDVVRGEIAKEDLQAILVGLDGDGGAIKVLDELLHEFLGEGLGCDGIGFYYYDVVHANMITLHRDKSKGVEKDSSEKWCEM